MVCHLRKSSDLDTVILKLISLNASENDSETQLSRLHFVVTLKAEVDDANRNHYHVKTKLSNYCFFYYRLFKALNSLCQV